MKISRRQFLHTSACAALSAGIPLSAFAAPTRSYNLTAQKSSAQILPDKYPKTDVWSYNGAVPGPVMRIKQGENLDILFKNELDVASSIHWHGVRVPNKMDGVPFITQAPIHPGEEFRYHFNAVDSGTFWFHPHLNSAEQVDRGLSGILIVEEDQPLDIDQELVWMLDDWRLGEDGQIINDFQNLHDKAHGGRLGNVTAVNGTYYPSFDVDNGSRIRLRLVNSSNARLYTPQFPNLNAWIIAFDGQPIAPKKLSENILRLGPGMRADIILDINVDSAKGIDILDTTYRGEPLPLAHFNVSGKNKARTTPPIALVSNPLSTPDLTNAEHKTIVYEGGAMGQLASARLNGDQETPLRNLVQQNGVVWATNGNVYTSLADLNKAKRLYQLRHGKSYIFSLQNKTSWIHPIHLHGHTYQVLARNGKKLDTPLWQDTVLLYPNETVDVAFVADNPGHWMFHCHILDHAAAGMIAALEVA